MPNLSLTDLVEVVSKSGTPKATKVAEVKNRPPYQPATDFYKTFRDRVIDIHKLGSAPSALGSIVLTLKDPKKKTNYAGVVSGYRTWWGRKSMKWFDPPRAIYSHLGVDVVVNPELGLTISGVNHVVKMYLKAEPITKLRIDLITVLMEVALRPQCQSGDVISILDVRRAKLFTVSAPIKPTQAVVDAELAYVAALWPSL